MAQVYNIAPEYAKGIFDLLKKKPDFDFSEVEELSKTAQEWHKYKKFRPSNGEKLVGLPPKVPVYNA